MNFFSNLFKSGPKPDLAEMLNNGAILLDVRSKGEYSQGHAKNAINIPLDVLSSNLSKLKKDKPIITVCASGMRSRGAASILKQNGFEAYNGGGWHNFK